MIANNISTERLLFGLIKTKAFETFAFFFSPLMCLQSMKDEQYF